MTRGLVELRKDVVEIDAIIGKAVEQSRLQLDRKMHRLAVHNEGSHPFVMGDRNCLVQGIVNLLNNAAKYMPEGRRVTLAIRTEGERVLVEVEDSGISQHQAAAPRLQAVHTGRAEAQSCPGRPGHWDRLGQNHRQLTRRRHHGE